MPRRGLPPGFANLFEIESDREEEAFSFPSKEAQREHLKQLLDHAIRGESFSHGDIVSYFPGTGPLKSNARPGLTLMFWRDVSPGGNPYDAALIKRLSPPETATLPYVDCMIAYFDGTDVHFDPSCSALLMKVTD